MSLVCKENCCIACGICASMCPKQCISYKYSPSHTTFADIDDEQCIKCALCKKVCPQINQVEKKEPYKCYSAWSLDEDIRKKSASGGIATELYIDALNKGAYICGVSFDNNLNAVYSISNDRKFLSGYQNSKYVFSSLGKIYFEIANLLEKGEAVLFIGVPCQVAAVSSFLRFKKIDVSKYYAVDLICHGMSPSDFLKDHVCKIENKKHKTTEKVYFRDPEFNTSTYTFSLYQSGNCFYSKNVKRADTYQIGYHCGISYRDNCYTCLYACLGRVGDLSLADFSYVGRIVPCSYDNKNVSCILCNTEKGEEMLQGIKSRCFIENRPIEEETKYEKQLIRPTPIPVQRTAFIKKYNESGSFDKAIKKSCFGNMVKKEIKHWLHVDVIRSVISKFIPSVLKDLFKHTERNGD